MANKDCKKVMGPQKLEIEVIFLVEFKLFARLDSNSSVELVITFFSVKYRINKGAYKITQNKT